MLLKAAGAAETGVCGGRTADATLGVEGGSAFGPPLVVGTTVVVAVAAVAFSCPLATAAGAGTLLADLDARNELDSEERDDAGAALFPSDDGVKGAADVSAVLVVAFAFLFVFTAGKRMQGSGGWGQYRRRSDGGGGVGVLLLFCEEVLDLCEIDCPISPTRGKRRLAADPFEVSSN